MVNYYIGMDVHCNNTELAVEKSCKIVERYSVPTTITAIAKVLQSLPGKKHLAMEEGPMAGWLYRNLSDKVERFIVSDPRRNKLIALDGDSDDKIDSGKLAVLLRGNYLRAVHHSLDVDMWCLKRWVGLYHDRVRDATRAINKIRAYGRMYGIKTPRGVLRDTAKRQQWLAAMEDRNAAEMLDLLWIGYDATARQAKLAKRQLIRRAGKYPIVKWWQELGGIGPIRAATIFAYLDTPWRFRRKNQLWKYCGLGLVHNSSGKDKHGRYKTGQFKLVWHANKRLKNAVMGATVCVINGKDNVFKDYYEKLIQNGLTQSNARHTVARKLLTVMWGMWKGSCRFDESLV
jgi:transposase